MVSVEVVNPTKQHLAAYSYTCMYYVVFILCPHISDHIIISVHP